MSAARTNARWAKRTCPATGTRVLEACEQERASLQPLPLLPGPFDTIVTRTVAIDGAVQYEGRTCSAPIPPVGQAVEVRGCAQRVRAPRRWVSWARAHRRSRPCSPSSDLTRLVEPLAAMRKDADPSPARPRRRMCLNVAPLIVDEMGFDPMTRQEASLIFRMESYRYGRGSVLITTDIGIRDWPDLLAGDENLATAIFERLRHHDHVLDISGRRTEELERAVSPRP